MAYTKKNPKEEKNAENLKTLKDRIKSGDTSGVYIFSGNELYMMDHYSHELSRSSDCELDTSYFTGRISFAEFCDCYNAVPMAEAFELDSVSMFGDSPAKAVKKKILKLDNPSFSDFSDAEASEFCEMLSDTGRMDIVIIYRPESSDNDRESKVQKSIMKKLAESALEVEFMHLPRQSAQLLKWIGKHFDKGGISYASSTLSSLTDQVGNDMYTLEHECEKLSAYVKSVGRTKLNPEDIALVCVKNAESIDFALSNAILSGSFKDAVREIRLAEQNKVPALILFGSIAAAVNTFCMVSAQKRKGKLPPDIAKATGIHSFVVSKNCEAIRERFYGKRELDFCRFASQKCMECDRTLKSFSGNDYRAIEMLMFELCKF